MISKFLKIFTNFIMLNYRYILSENTRFAEASAIKTAEHLIKEVERYFKGKNTPQELLQYCQTYLASLLGTGTEKFRDDLPEYYDNIDGNIVAKVIAYICIRSSDCPKARAFFEKFGEQIGYDPQVLDLAIKLSQENLNSLPQNQQAAQNILRR